MASVRGGLTAEDPDQIRTPPHVSSVILHSPFLYFQPSEIRYDWCTPNVAWVLNHCANLSVWLPRNDRRLLLAQHQNTLLLAPTT